MSARGGASGRVALKFSTDGIDPRERFDYWREERGSKLFGVSMELERDLRPKFAGRFEARSIGGATLVDMSAEQSYEIERTAHHIAETPGNALCIAQLIAGEGWQSTCGAEFRAGAGTFTVGHTDAPYRNGSLGPGGFHILALRLPLAPDRDLLPQGPESMHFLPLDPSDGAQALLREYFRAFARHADQLDDTVAKAAVRCLTDLALVVRGGLARDDASGRAAVDAALLQMARDQVEQQMHLENLTPARVAALCGISVRKLHLLFEPTGTTFSRYLLRRRLERARQLLDRRQPLAMAEIAHACGFASLATFYRAFRSAFGCAPGEVRAGKDAG